MRASSFTPILFVASLFVTACGGKVVVDGDGDSAGAGGSGGAGSSSSSTATSTSTGTSPALCGGESGTPCAVGEFCDFNPESACGSFDDLGVCKPIPNGCTDDCPGVCGCDGAFYCNECSAQMAGVDVSPDQSCNLPGEAAYWALVLATGAPRFAIMKGYPDQDICFMVVVTGASGSSAFAVETPMGWAIESVRAIQGLAFCKDAGLNPWPPPEVTVEAEGAVGFLEFPPAQTFPCTVNLHAELIFPGGAPWVPGQESMDVDDLPVQGGCF